MHAPQADDQARKLAEFLRRNPSALTWSAKEIAAKSGVDESIAAMAASSDLKRLNRAQGSLADPALVVWFMRFMERPTRDFHTVFVVTSLIICLGPASRISNVLADSVILEIVLPVLAALAVVLQAATVIRHGDTLKAIQGTIIFSVTLVVTVLLSSHLGRQQLERSGADLVAFLMSVAVFVSILHLAVSLLFAQAGVWFRTEREKRDLSRMSRFDLLSRYLALHDRIHLTEGEDGVKSLPKTHPLVNWYQQNAYWVAIVTGFMITLQMLLIPGVAQFSQQRFDPSKIEGGILLVFAITTLVSFCVQLAAAFFARGMLHAILVSLALLVGGYLVVLLPPGLVDTSFIRRLDPEPHIGNLLNSLIFALFGGFAALMTKRLAMRRQIQENQPQALLAQSIEIQRLLTPIPKDVTVMVVDAVGSSSMKAESEPFEAEWSFRAYQILLNEIVEEHEGTLFATAGDGATFFFDEPAHALAAAREIQTSLHVFNEKVNRITRQFRVRIGLHSGQVAGFIDDVEYSSVIDIAAHIEKVCRPGQIALSGATHDLIRPSDAQLQDLIVDDQRLYLVPGNGP